MSSLKSRLLVSVVCIPLLLWIVLWGPVWVLKFALSILSMIAAWEMLACVGRQTEKVPNVFTVLTVMAALSTVVLGASLWPILWAVYVVIAFLYAIIRAGEVKFVQVLAGIFSVIAVPYAFSALLRIADMGLHRAYLLLPFILSFACDTFAYFVGCSIGKHKLAPKVSPKKTVEGAFGGVLGCIAGFALYGFIIQSVSDVKVNYLAMIVLAVVISVISQFGDLVASYIKREREIKDFGFIFPGHGGVLDRFDSIIAVAPAIYFITYFTSGFAPIFIC